MNGDARDLIVRPPVHLLLAAVATGGVFYILGQYIASQPQRIEQEVEAKREITVQGHGEVQGRPDVARFTIGLTTGTQPTAAAALDILRKRFDAIVAAVKASGIAEEDVKTTNLSIQPQYEYRDGRQIIRGFEASESVELTIRDLGKIGDILAKATGEGVNVAGGLTFEIDDPQELQQNAQEEAITDAQENAQQLARLLDVRLGRVKGFSVSAPSDTHPYFADVALEAARGGPAAPPVPSGTQDVVVTVTITYEIK